MTNTKHKGSPFKFLDSYSSADNDIFFGREKEVEELYSKSFQSKLMLVYGASGTGKSSIINCGLANKFDESDWLPVYTRRRGNILNSLYSQLQKLSVTPVKTEVKEEYHSDDFKGLIGSLYLDYFRPIYLIFDQFEELFVFGYKEEWRSFIKVVKALMDSDLDVHFIFVIRGEYLEFLSEFEEYIPDFFDNRLRIERMTRVNAEKSITMPASLYNIDIEEGFEEKLLKKISPDKAHIELTFLQVFLDKIYQQAKALRDEEESITMTLDHIENLGPLGDVLAEFVDEQLFKMDNPKASLAVLKSFVSLEGTKRQMNQSDVIAYTASIGQKLSIHEVEGILIQFVNKRILKEQDENGLYELRHDSLAQKIHEKITHQEREILDIRQFMTHSLYEYKKRGTLLSDEDLGYIAAFERNYTLDEEMTSFVELSKYHSSKKRKQRRSRLVILALVVLLALTSIIGFVVSRNQKEKAEESARIALNQRKEAEYQRKQAELQKSQADENAKIAELEAEKAENEKQKADKSRLEALQAQKLAEQQKEIAETQTKLALIAEQKAEEQKLQALQNQEIAEQQKEKATELRILGMARELAIKSTRVIDVNLRGLLTLQALKFYRTYAQEPRESDIYAALINASNALGIKDQYATQVHSSVITGLVIQGDKAITASHDNILAITDLSSMQVASKLPINKAISLVEPVLGTNQLVMVSIDGIVDFYDAENQTVLWSEGYNDTPVYLDIIDGIIRVVFSNEIVGISFEGAEQFRFALSQPFKSAIGNNKDIWLSDFQGKLHQFNSGVLLLSKMNFSRYGSINSMAVLRGKNQMVAGFESGLLAVIDLSENKVVQLLPGHTASIVDIKIHDSKPLILTGSYDRTLRLWNLERPEEEPIVLNDNAWVSQVGFDNKGSFYSTNYQGVVRKYPLVMDEIANIFCAKIQRSLSESEWNKYVADDITYEKMCDDE